MFDKFSYFDPFETIFGKVTEVGRANQIKKKTP